MERPHNANQLAQGLGLDYKTVEYNLRVLLKHVLVVCPDPDQYGALYFPSKNLLATRSEFESIASQLQVAPGPRPPEPTPGTTQLGKTVK